MPTFTTSGKLFSGWAMDRSVFRKLLPDARLIAYAAGWVDPGDVNTATVSLVYQKDDTTTVTLGSVTQSGSGLVKKSMGPFDVFGTGGVPAGETIPMIRLFAQKNAGANGTVLNWNIQLRFITQRA